MVPCHVAQGPPNFTLQRTGRSRCSRRPLSVAVRRIGGPGRDGV